MYEIAVWYLLQVLSYLTNGGIESESTISGDFCQIFLILRTDKNAIRFSHIFIVILLLMNIYIFIFINICLKNNIRKFANSTKSWKQIFSDFKVQKTRQKHHLLKLFLKRCLLEGAYWVFITFRDKSLNGNYMKL